MDKAAVAGFRRALLGWFDQHKRELPWRKDREPYHVWVSEIMLQQTRVAAVLEHYLRFLERFPNLQALARAQEQSVLAAWSGLGYYRRARMMHTAARQIVRESAGRFPETSAAWRELPGIGRYTAAAIASICYDEPCAVVDGNVERVLERVRGASKEQFWQMAQEMLSPRRPGDFNQAMMELGATVCVPKVPECTGCPVAKFCRTRMGEAHVSRRTPATRTKRELAYLLVTDNSRVLLVQRGSNETVMPAMWELPSENSELAAQPAFLVRHSIMNTDYLVHVVRRDVGEMASMKDMKWVELQLATELALTGLARKILKRARLIQNQ